MSVPSAMSARNSTTTAASAAAGAGKKKGGGFLARQAKAKTMTEEELLRKGESISPDDVLKLNKVTESKYGL